jgi:hypothetical protein
MFMTEANTTPKLAAADLSAERAERRLRILQELAEIGMDLADKVEARALAPETDPAVAEELVLSFCDIAQAVRETIALEARLRRDHQVNATERAERRARATRRKVAWDQAGGGANGPLHISSAPEAEPGTGRAETACSAPTARALRSGRG